MMPWIIFPDTVDVAEMATGARPTGTYSGMMTLARKVGGGLGVGMVGWIIGGLGYISNESNDPSAYEAQSSTVLLTIRLALGISVAVFITIALIASFKYKSTAPSSLASAISSRRESQERSSLMRNLKKENRSSVSFTARSIPTTLLKS